MPKKIVLSEAAYYDIDSMFAYISQEGKQAYEGLVGFAGGCGRKSPPLATAWGSSVSPAVRTG